MSTNPRFRDRFRYRLDNLLARGTWAALLVLGALTITALVISALALAVANVTFAGSEESSFVEDLWQSTLRVIDAGTMASDVGWGRRALALVITIFGILVAGTMIGVIANGVEQRVEQMQRGRSVVIESGHAVVLGASTRLPTVVDQLTLANRKRRSTAIVVLADMDLRELADAVRSGVPDLRGSRLVFRRGDPRRRADLTTAAVRDSRLVIVTANDTDGDAGVVTAVVAVGAELGGFDRIPIIAELANPETAARLAAASGGQVHPVVPLLVTARIIAFSRRQPGLQQVAEELLDFRGSDVYVGELGDLAGSTFGEMVHRFPRAHPIGRLVADGTVELNPAPSTRLAEGDRLVAIADEVADLEATLAVPDDWSPPSATRPPPLHRSQPERIVIVGWNELGRQLLGQLRETGVPGSTVEIVYDSRLVEPDDLPASDQDGLTVTLTPTRGDSWQPRIGRELTETTSIILLAYRRTISAAEADSRTLLNLLTLTRQRNEHGAPGVRLVAELIDEGNVELARVTGADDLIVSDAISSRFIVQLAGQPERRSVLLSLYATEGPSLHLVEACDLGAAGERSWRDIIGDAQAAGLLAIGWRHSSARGGRLALNPHVDDRVSLAPDDLIVVIG